MFHEYYECLRVLKRVALTVIAISDKRGIPRMSVYRPQERRLVLRLMAYWDDLRVDESFPCVSDVEPTDIGDDWAHCHVLELSQAVTESRFVHIGYEIGGDLPKSWDRKLGTIPRDTLLHHATSYIDRLLAKGVPMSLGGQAALTGNSVLYRSILLPLSTDGSTIDFVLGAANCRVVSEDEARATGEDD